MVLVEEHDDHYHDYHFYDVDNSTVKTSYRSAVLQVGKKYEVVLLRSGQRWTGTSPTGVWKSTPRACTRLKKTRAPRSLVVMASLLMEGKCLVKFWDCRKLIFLRPHKNSTVHRVCQRLFPALGISLSIPLDG